MTIPVRTFSADPTLEWDTPPPECALSSQEATYQTEQWLLNSCAWREASEAALGGETEVIVTAGQQTMLGPGGYQLQDGDSAELTVETTEGIPLVHAFVDHIEYAKLSLSNAENNYVPVSDDYICHTASGL